MKGGIKANHAKINNNNAQMTAKNAEIRAQFVELIRIIRGMRVSFYVTMWLYWVSGIPETCS